MCVLPYGFRILGFEPYTLTLTLTPFHMEAPSQVHLILELPPYNPSSARPLLGGIAAVSHVHHGVHWL